MRWFLIGVLLGLALLCARPVQAYRTARPPIFSEWNTNTFTQLNNTLADLWSLSNGRYTLDRVTTTPKGNRTGNVGDMVFYNTGTNQLCINVDGTKTGWSCTNLMPL